MLTGRECMRYFKRRRYGGRSALARALDYAALRLILFAAVFLCLRAGVGAARAAVLALIALCAASLLLRALREALMARFVRAELLRIRALLLCERLPYLDEADFLLLCRRASGCEEPAAMQRAEPLGADALLPLLRRPGGETAVCASAGFTAAAQAFAARAPRRARLIGPEELAAAAHPDDPFYPDDGAVEAYIASQRPMRAALRVRLRQAADALRTAGAGKKYLLLAALLLLASFLTRYALYYRMLAGLCLAIAAAGAFAARPPHAKPPG